MKSSPPSLNLFLCFGDHPSQSSLLTRFALENQYLYIDCKSDQSIFQNSMHHQGQNSSKSIILNNIPLDLKSFVQAQKNFKNHRTIVLYFKLSGQQTEETREFISRHYKKLGVLKVIELAEGNVQEDYKHLKRKLLSKVVFVYGAPRSGRTELAHKIQQALGYTYIHFDDLRNKLGQSDEVGLVNRLIKFLASSSKNIVFDGFFKSRAPLTVLLDYVQPLKVYHIQSSSDQIQSQLQQIKDKQQKASKTKQFQQYLDRKDEITNYLKNKPYFQNVTLQQQQEIVNSLRPTLLYIKDHDRDFIDELAVAWEGTHLNIQHLLQTQMERQKLTVGDNISEKIGYLKTVIGSTNGRVILSGFSDDVQDFLELESTIGQIKYYFTFAEQQQKYSDRITPQMYYLGKQKLITLQSKNTALILSYLDKRNIYLTISGPESSGKSQIAKIIARDYGYKHIQFQPFITQYKEKHPSEQGDQLPLTKIINIFKQQIASNKTKYIIEGLPYEGNDLSQWIKEVGCPVAINLRLDNEKWLARYRKKNEIDASTEVTEQDQERINTAQQKNTNYIKSIEQTYQKYPNIKLFQFDCNSPLITLENFLPLILKPRVYLVSEGQSTQNLLFLNIALRYRMSYIDLSTVDLRSVPSITQTNPLQRDIVLYNYSSKDRFVSDDIYFIQNKIGVIRFICVWTEEEKQFKDQRMNLQRPVVETKKKRQTEQGKQQQPVQEQPPAEQDVDENGQPRKSKFDIYSYEWTQPGTSKNLTQWFLNSKKPMKEYLFQQSNQKQVYDDFELIINELNRDRTTNIYTLIK